MPLRRSEQWFQNATNYIEELEQQLAASQREVERLKDELEIKRGSHLLLNEAVPRMEATHKELTRLQAALDEAKSWIGLLLDGAHGDTRQRAAAFLAAQEKK